MRLTDELAARRRLYPRPFFTAPAVMIIDIPRRLAGPGLSLGRYYPVILENGEEVTEFEAYLAAERPALIAPDLFATRPTSSQIAAITFFEFVPPEAGWPWVLLCQWPKEHAMRVSDVPDLLARGAYTIETFASREELVSAAARFIGTLGGIASLRTIIGSPDGFGRA